MLAICRFVFYFTVMKAVSGEFYIRQSGDIVIGLILPLRHASNGTPCASEDLARIIEVEAMLYTINKSRTGLRVGWDVVDACAQSNVDRALDAWFGKPLNHSTANSPIAIVTDFARKHRFGDVVRRVKIFSVFSHVNIPILSVNEHTNIWTNSYTMKPSKATLHKALISLVSFLGWNILDVFVYKEYEEMRNFRKMAEMREICVLDELLIWDWETAGPSDWLRRRDGNASVAVVFSSVDDVSKMTKFAWDDGHIKEFLLAWEIPGSNDTWEESLRGSLGLQQDHGDLRDFEVHLEYSGRVQDWFSNGSCSDTDNCVEKSRVLKRLSYHGAGIIDAVSVILEAVKATGLNRFLETGLSGVSAQSLTGHTVSFDWQRNLATIEYNVLNFQQRIDVVKAVKVGQVAVQQTVTVSVDRTDIIWRGMSQPRSRCSADCQPGSKRVPWPSSPSGKCCWDCAACPRETVASYANSTQCLECPSGSRPTADQTKCRTVYVDYLKWHEPFSLVMIFLITFTVCFFLYTVNLYVKKAHTPVFAGSKCATMPILLSLFITLILPILLLIKPSQTSCGAYVAIFTFGLGIPLTLLVVRSHFVHNLCYDESGQLRRKWYRFNPQTVISLIMIIFLLIYVVTFLNIFPPEVLVHSGNNTHVDYIECSVHSRPRFLPYVFYVLALVLAFNVFHMNEESLEETHDEAKYVSLTIYLMYIYMFVYFVAVYAIDGKKKVRIICAMAYLIALNFFATIFLPKVYVVLFRPEKNKAEDPLLSPAQVDGEVSGSEAKGSNTEGTVSPEPSSGHSLYNYTEV